jgi:DNA topoisomerase II
MTTIEKTYKKISQHQHVLLRPDTYIGPNVMVCEEQFIFDDSSCSIVKKVIEYNPGLIKIFDEILVNAIDHSVRDSSVTTIKVSINSDTGEISVCNNGKGIPIVKHQEHGIYIPEMLFGNLLTSSNYNDSEKRIVGGMNGLGSTCTNIYSKKFVVETVDSGKYYHQEFSDNMYYKTEPKITKTSVKSYTKITFVPDYPRFKMSGITTDVISLLKKRVYDCVACTNKNINVVFNDQKLKQKTFQSYIELYNIDEVIHEKFEEGKFIWEYSVGLNDSYQQVSFVNGISTTQGGKHVDHIFNQIIKKLTDTIQSKKKISGIKPSHIKDKLFLFVRATIVNPNFSSQSKEKLETPVKDFGVKIEVSDNLIKKLYKSSLTDDLISFSKYIAQKDFDKQLSKGLNVKKKSILKIPNLDDANLAGTKDSDKCTLILTEGLSAKTFAVSGLGVIGRDKFGVFPLRGKLLNVREATQMQLLNNEEIKNIKLILGLQHNTKYTKESMKDLRYGSILILTDSDEDGHHIKGLIINMFHYWYPELLYNQGFIKTLKTPIVKASNRKIIKEFYTIQDFKNWEGKNVGSWNIKYYKGLGTSTKEEARDAFSKMSNNIVNYFSDSKQSTDRSLILAFEKKQADARKDWLLDYNFELFLDQTESDISYTDFINKELIHFSMYDVIRSIPSVCDGFKPSQRKVLFTMLKRNYTKEIKVAQLGAEIAKITNYHHGEQSLFGTIINMAQDYTGSNNINLLKPCGAFGTRLHCGKDSASPRYIFTELSKITKKIFVSDDLEVIPRQTDDGESIEPRFYIPVLPMILINGGKGIGTGYSTDIPCYNPDDIIENIKRYLNGESLKEMTPWYSGFTGKIVKVSEGKFESQGKVNIKSGKIQITEIPIGIGIEDYKNFLENLCDDIIITNNSTETNVDFVLSFTSRIKFEEFINKDILSKTLKLTRPISTKNFHLINHLGNITKYQSAEEILVDFVKIRLNYNQKRKEWLITNYNKNLDILKNKIRFLSEITSEQIVVYRKTKKEIEELLTDRAYTKVSGNYSYLISLPIYSLTIDSIKELQKEAEIIENKWNIIKSKTTVDILLDDLSNLMK